jgi:hypothetical protein
MPGEVAMQGAGWAPGAPYLDGGRRPLPAVRTPAAAGSGSAADAGGRQGQAVVRPGSGCLGALCSSHLCP